MSFLSTLKSKFEKRVVDSRSAWRQLVATVADGADADPGMAFELMQTLGKGVDDLEAEASQLRKRREEAIVVVAGRNATDQLPKIRERIAAADADLEAAMKRHKELVRPLILKKQDLEQAETQGRSARDRLISSCKCVELIEERDELRRQTQHVEQERAKLGGAIEAKEAGFSRRLQIREAGDDAAVESAREQVAAEIKELQDQYASFNQQLLDIDSAFVALQDRMAAAGAI